MRAREIMDQKREKEQAHKSTFTLDKQAFFETRVVKAEDAIIVERANRCQARCQQPSEVLKRILSANLKAVSENV